MARPRILLLFSGGLDSLVAAKLLREVGAALQALHFMTPFTGSESGLPGEGYLAEWKVPLRRVRISLAEYLPLVTAPPHGFGRALNACIDCKILFLKKASQIAEHEGFDAVATGEVLGERPMSQNRLSLEIIERESGLGEKLLRPLSAALLAPSEVEDKGLIDRSKLLAIEGRGRKPQLELAKRWGIVDFATPSGGCLLTEPQYSAKLRDLLGHPDELSEETVALLKVGRHFRRHPQGAKLVVGKDKKDNEELLRHPGESRFFFEVKGTGSPVGLLFLNSAVKDGVFSGFESPGPPTKDEVFCRGESSGSPIKNEVFYWGASIVARYSDDRDKAQVTVTMWDKDGIEKTISVSPARVEEVERWRL